jgi:hypothetical protein
LKKAVTENELKILPQDKDGGYYAIKGFMYQFDLTIMQILENPDKDIQFENVQDIDFENYVIQVKHKETQDYKPSKIKTPLIQLLKLFIEDSSKKYYLFCYFKDISPQEKTFSIDELNNLLGNKKDDFSNDIKKAFVGSFILKFTDDYEAQFATLLIQIEQSYELSDRNMSLYYHSIFRSEIFRLVIKERKLRFINKGLLDNLIKKYQDLVFYSVYNNYLSKETYEKFIKKAFFTQKTINIPNFERLIIIDNNQSWDIPGIHSIIHNLSKKFYRKDKSPAPFVCFRNINRETLNLIKQEMIDLNFPFNDGTFFNGDKFRLDKLINPLDINTVVRFIDEEHLEDLFRSKTIHETYQFFINSKIEVPTIYKHIKIQLTDVEQINQILS